MKNQVLTIEQMRRLKELGIDTGKVSMIYVDYDIPKSGISLEIFDTSRTYPHRNIPAFTLQDILELIKNQCECFLDLSLNPNAKWEVKFTSLLNNKAGGFMYSHNDPLYAAYEVLVWVAENGYLKGGPQ